MNPGDVVMIALLDAAGTIKISRSVLRVSSGPVAAPG
jgi:hypothetical protein